MIGVVLLAGGGVGFEKLLLHGGAGGFEQDEHAEISDRIRGAQIHLAGAAGGLLPTGRCEDLAHVAGGDGSNCGASAAAQQERGREKTNLWSHVILLICADPS